MRGTVASRIVPEPAEKERCIFARLAARGEAATTKAILLDAGNTLLHLDYAWLAAAAQGLGCTIREEGVGVAAAGVGRRGWPAPLIDDRPTAFFPGYFGAIGEAIGLARDAAAQFAAAAEREHLRDPRGLWRIPAPEAAAVLEELAARGIMLGVVSNSDGRVEQQLTAAGLRAPLRVVVDSYLVGVEKPDPRIFRIALDLLEVDAAEAWYVGDLLQVDVKGAQSAGMAALLYDPWDAYPELATGRIQALAELLRLPPL